MQQRGRESSRPVRCKWGRGPWAMQDARQHPSTGDNYETSIFVVPSHLLRGACKVPARVEEKEA